MRIIHRRNPLSTFPPSTPLSVPCVINGHLQEIVYNTNLSSNAENDQTPPIYASNVSLSNTLFGFFGLNIRIGWPQIITES